MSKLMENATTLLGLVDSYAKSLMCEHLEWSAEHEAMLSEIRAAVAELEMDAAIGRLVRSKLVSGNSVPVERCIIRADEIKAMDTIPN